MIPRQKTPMSTLIRELRLHNRHQDALASGRVQPADEEEDYDWNTKAGWANLTKPKHTYSVVSDDRQSGWYGPGMGVMCNQTGCLVNDEPFETEAKANRFLDEIEEGER